MRQPRVNKRLAEVVVLMLIALGAWHVSRPFFDLTKIKYTKDLSSVDDTEVFKLGLLINTTNCKIPDFPPWSDVAMTLMPKRCSSFFKGEPNCADKHLHGWSYVNGSYLHINLTAVKESGYSWNTIRCCYRVIIWKQKGLVNDSDIHEKDLLAAVRYSEDCHRIKSPRQYIYAEFIRLQCVSTSLPLLNDVVSREFFAIAKPGKPAVKKIQKWTAIKKRANVTAPSPPNVIIFGVDTMSRLSSWRNFNDKTFEVLRSIGAVEMKGYTKVGENTYPNMAAIMAGHTSADLFFDYCRVNGSFHLAYCPYLWKPFSRVGYLTAAMQDSYFGTFRKMGFFHKPTDFFFRPLMFAVYNNLNRSPYYWYMRCLGRHKIEEVILKYLQDILKVAAPSGAPVFAHLWLSSASHECGTSSRYVDGLYASTIQSITSTYYNTVLVFMGDHGQLHGEFRETLQGWYEGKLPMAWIYIPPHLRERFPGWYKGLQINSNRLTSHFDMYKTLVHVLRTFDKNKAAEGTYDKLTIQSGQSLFDPVPADRTCPSAGIPIGHCACSAPEDVSLADVWVIEAARVAAENISSFLPPVCKNQTVKDIKKARSFTTMEGHRVYVIAFVTAPGDFLFEATVRERNVGGSELILTNPILRLSTMATKPSCVSDPVLEKFCYCA